MKALALNCTLKRSPEDSSTQALTDVVMYALAELGAETEHVRVADLNIEPGVVSEAVTDRDDWPALREKIIEADILVMGLPTWIGQPSSISKRVLERMDALISETQEDGRPIVYDKVAGVVVVGNEDGAHHCIMETSGALGDIGFTIPAQAWTYWNKGPGPGDTVYLTADDQEWSKTTGHTCAQNLFAVATALKAHPLPPMAT